MRKNIWLLLLCVSAAVILSGCKSETPPEDQQPVPEASVDPSGMGGSGFGGSAGLDSSSGGGFGGGPGADG